MAARPVDLKGWFAELKRRRVIRALVGYGIAAFAVLQVIEPIMHGAHWPDIVLSYVVAGLAAGFPVVIALAWVFDVRGGRIERTASAEPHSQPRGIRLALLLVAIGVLSAAPGVFYYFVVRGAGRSFSSEGSNSGSNASSIAVLPFASLSIGEENAYFAQGFHDELLRQMGGIGDLRVISRTSVLQYKEGARNLREIAEALGVSFIVEGSVQRSANRVRVEAKLIDARSDRQMWADRYDRDLIDIFGIQTAVAEEIARALHARLSPTQKAQIEQKPTESAPAYDLYLRAQEYALRPGNQPDNLEIAERLYRQAIQIDPSFALARARLAHVMLRRFWFAAETPDSVAEEARLQAEQALRLRPDLPDGHLEMGRYHYFRWGDYGSALREFEIARAGAPVDASELIGFVLRRQGKFEDAIRNQREAVRLNPRSPPSMYQLAQTLLWTRRYEEAAEVLDRAETIAPDFALASMVKAVLCEAWKGETDLATTILRNSRGRLDPRGRIGQEDWITIIVQHNPREALPILDSIEANSITGIWGVCPKAFLYAVAYEALGDKAQARKQYEEARIALEALAAAVEKKREHSTPIERSLLLARTYAALGRKEDALREARRGIERLPISKDAFFGCDVEVYRAAVEARVGEPDAAIEHIRHLLSIPCLLSPGLLRIDPMWAPLRDDPRFRRLAELN